MKFCGFVHFALPICLLHYSLHSLACAEQWRTKDMIYCKSQMFDENIYHFSLSDTCNYMNNRTFQQSSIYRPSVQVHWLGWYSLLIGVWILYPWKKNTLWFTYLAMWWHKIPGLKTHLKKTCYNLHLLYSQVSNMYTTYILTKVKALC